MVLARTHVPFIICPIAFRVPFLAEATTLDGPRRLFTKEELSAGIFFSYDERATLYLMERYGYSRSLALERLDDLTFLPKQSSRPRVASLIALKEELDAKGLLRRTPTFSFGFAGKRALVIGYAKDDPELAMLAHMLSITLEWEPSGPVYPHVVNEFTSINQEVDFAMNQAAQLIDKGVPLNQIFFAFSSSDYNLPLAIASRHFGIPINLDSPGCWGDTPLGLSASAMYQEGMPIEEISNRLVLDYDLDASHPVIKALVSVERLEGSTFVKKRYLHDYLKQLQIDPPVFDPAIRRLEAPYPSTDRHIFILGANQGEFPLIHGDTNYLSDEDRHAIGRLTSKNKNAHESAVWSRFLDATLNVTISYRREGSSGQAYISSLLNQKNYPLVSSPPIDTEYGIASSRIKLAIMLDQKRVYHIENALIKPYGEALRIPYRDFDYKFKPFGEAKSDRYVKLNYTKLDDFNKCRYRYYLQYELKLDEFAGNFYSNFGKLAHQLLERSALLGFNFDATYDELKPIYHFTMREETLLPKLLDNIKAVISFNQEHKDHMLKPEIMTELRLAFPLDDHAEFNGTIDKVVLTRLDQRRFAAFIDYKTGDESFKPDKLQYGLSLQLPCYGLLLSKQEGYDDMETIGYYIQNINPAPIIKHPDDDLERVFQSKLRLNGISTTNMAALSSFDDTMVASQYLVGIKVTKENKFYYPARVVDGAEFSKYVAQALTQAQAAKNAIRDEQYTIDPKRIGKDYSCSYCPFRDVCFRPEAAVKKIYIETEDDDDESDLE